MNEKGLFVSFEGGEGSGKTTLVNRLAKALQELGYSTVNTREPGGTALGERLRSFLLNHQTDLSIIPKAELLLFLAGRIQHIEKVILPALQAGKIVLCDRFHDSTIAYQGAARGLGVQWVQELCQLSCSHFEPNLTFLLDLDPAQGLERTLRAEKQEAAAGALDRIETEKLEFHQLVRQAMLQLAQENPKRIKVIDGSQSKDAVFDEAYEQLIKELRDISSCGYSPEGRIGL